MIIIERSFQSHGDKFPRCRTSKEHTSKAWALCLLQVLEKVPRTTDSFLTVNLFSTYITEQGRCWAFYFTQQASCHVLPLQELTHTQGLITTCTMMTLITLFLALTLSLSFRPINPTTCWLDRHTHRHIDVS